MKKYIFYNSTPLNLSKLLSPFNPHHFPKLGKTSVIYLCFHFLLLFIQSSSEHGPFQSNQVN